MSLPFRIIDRTQIYSESRKLNDGCLVISIASELIENNGEDAESQKAVSEEEKIVDGKAVRKQFQRLTSIRITKKNAEKAAEAGRKRWKIENEGFNRQKNWQGDITHACSCNEEPLPDDADSRYGKAAV